ncbi:MAG: hypothetical protein P8L68_15845 [Paracoccaceae bacterium]|nr:hypothetical protein [Paracoccaceae bacterium]MDG2259957.1 hypothetical protein [Paracoccaceae bacterium]
MRHLVFILILTATPLSAQSLQDRAAAQIDALGPVTQTLTQSALEEVVLPFETATPFEASLGDGDLSDAIIATRAGDSTASQAFRATVDSATGRPDVAPSNGALGLANLAVSIGADSVVGMFSGNSGSCTSAFDGPIASGTYNCSAPLTQDFRYCHEERQVTVHRTDKWSCAEETPEYRKTCSKNVEWRCTGTTGGACLKEAVQVSRPVSWNASGDRVETTFSGGGTGACSLREKTVQISVQDIAQITSLRLEDITYQGVAQVRINGQNVWTQGTSGGSNLAVRSRDCGKNCAVDAVYAGNTWIADCSATPNARTPGIELEPEFSQATPGPNSSLESTPVRALTGSQSLPLQITLITANTQESGPTLRFALRGSCCSEFTASLGDAC